VGNSGPDAASSPAAITAVGGTVGPRGDGSTAVTGRQEVALRPSPHPDPELDLICGGGAELSTVGDFAVATALEGEQGAWVGT
jgi:hypothetical protein